jgi:hypothetical protein
MVRTSRRSSTNGNGGSNDLSVEDAARIIYYHFRHEQFTLAADTFGWGEDRALDWTRERVENVLLNS